ncbi:SDR family oxidoreductase [Candidatus Harpocratesius sp.]
MKVLIIGANGFLGRKVIELYQKTDDVFGADVVLKQFPFDCPILKLDITNADEVMQCLTEYKPDLSILTAAMTNVDACEYFPDRAYAINALGPKNVAHAVKQIGGKLIYISTDFIFDGSRGNYSETDAPNPLSIYGKSKLQGEQFILDEGVRACICRTSVLYGWPGAGQRDNFFSWAYKSLVAGKTLSIIDGQITTPTLVNDLAECIYWMRDFENSEIFHTAGPEAVSRLVFVEKIMETMITKNLKERLFPNLGTIERITTLKQKAIRPADSSLNTTKIQTTWESHFLGVSEALSRLFLGK